MIIAGTKSGKDTKIITAFFVLNRGYYENTFLYLGPCAPDFLIVRFVGYFG